MDPNMYCPYCGNRDLKTIRGKDPDYDVNITAWNCPSCESTFRDPDDIRRFIKGEHTGKTILRIFTMIIPIIGFIGAAILADLSAGFLVGIVGSLIAWGCYWLACKEIDKRTDKLKAELSQIEAGLKRFAK
ncbi:MAG: hypothetical protein ACI3V3_04460 [Faecousia sp.]